MFPLTFTKGNEQKRSHLSHQRGRHQSSHNPILLSRSFRPSTEHYSTCSTLYTLVLLTSNTTMKLLLLLAFFTATVVGFSPSSMATRRGVVSRLHAASGLPQTKFGSTEPVADRPVSKMERNRMKDRMIDPDYTLTIGTAALCPLIIWYHSTIASRTFFF